MKKNGWFVEKRCGSRLYEGVGCNSLLIIETDDLFIATSEKKHDNNVYYYFATCPHCGLENIIENIFIPSNIRRKIGNRQNGKVRIKRK